MQVIDVLCRGVIVKHAVAAGAMIAATSLSSVLAAEPTMDWPHWRGPEQSGVSHETGLIDEFNPKGGAGSNVLWKNVDAAGISTPIVMNGRIYTIVRDHPGTPKDAEKVICLDATSGEMVWQNVYNVFLSDVPAERVGWSHVTGDLQTGNVFALGACCLLQCIDGETGETQWSRSLSEEFGMLSTYGGRTNTPIVFEDLVIISGVTTGWDETARPAHRYLAFEKSNGQLAWLTSTAPLPEDTTYSTPVISTINGQSVMIAGAGDGYLYAMQPRTGKVMWREAISRRGINTTVAVDSGGQVFATHGEENPRGTAMGAAIRVDATVASAESASAEVWRTEKLMIGKSSPLIVNNNRLYVVEDSGELHVLDATNGEEIGEPLKLGTSMRGSLVYADGKIYGCTAAGIFHILRPTEDGVESVFKVRLPRDHEVGGSIAISHGRIYLPTSAGMYCLGAADQQPQLAAAAQTSSAPLQETEDDDTVAALLQIIPAEAIVTSGSELPLRVVAYNARGQRLETSPDELSFDVAGVGEIGDDAIYRAPQGTQQHAAATVTVRSGEISGTARMRVIPPLPWGFDFSDDQVPITWIGARYRHEPRVIDDNPAIVKISTIPKGTRSQSWMGPTDLSDYTITANVKSSAAAKLPDMGVIAQRYTLDLMGESQQLQVRTWPAQLRMAKSVPYSWKADTWYTLKLSASNEDGVAVLRGKVWPRDEKEPPEWTVTATDEAPNLQGSPGLFGNATNAEFFIDDVRVTPNG